LGDAQRFGTEIKTWDVAPASAVVLDEVLIRCGGDLSVGPPGASGPAHAALERACALSSERQTLVAVMQCVVPCLGCAGLVLPPASDAA